VSKLAPAKSGGTSAAAKLIGAITGAILPLAAIPHFDGFGPAFWITAGSMVAIASVLRLAKAKSRLDQRLAEQAATSTTTVTQVVRIAPRSNVQVSWRPERRLRFAVLAARLAYFRSSEYLTGWDPQQQLAAELFTGVLIIPTALPVLVTKPSPLAPSPAAGQVPDAMLRSDSAQPDFSSALPSPLFSCWSRSCPAC
jgi:hypothetical protein